MKRSAIAALSCSTIAIALAYASAFLPDGAGMLSAILMILGIATMAVSLMILGAVRAGHRLGPLRYALGFLFVVFVLGFGIPLFLSDGAAVSTGLWLGLPRTTAIIVYGVGVLPVLVLPLVYAWTFEDHTLRQEDIERVRELASKRSHKADANE